MAEPSTVTVVIPAFNEAAIVGPVVGALASAGFEDLVVYDSSWTEWGADPATPKARH